MKKIVSIGMGFVLIGLLSYCSKSEITSTAAAIYDASIDPCATSTINYDTEVQPILNESCAMSNCHDSNGAHNVKLNNYTNTINTGGVEPGNPAGSLLITEITSLKMPTGGKTISSANIEVLNTWILQGALNKVCTSSIN